MTVPKAFLQSAFLPFARGCSRASGGLAVALLMLASCGGSDSPVQAQLGVGEIEVSVGPGGARVQGTGVLAGMTLEIPKGALRQLVQLKISPGDAISLPESLAAAPAVRIEAVPDPGPLLVPAVLTSAVAFPETREPADLFIAGRVPVPSFTEPSDRVGLAAEVGTYDRELQLFTAEIGGLHDLQVRYTAAPRQVDDANALVTLALDALDRLTNESLAEADVQLGAAVQADPYFAAARVLRALTRVLVVLNGRDTRGPGLQSIGEAATRFGLDLTRRSLLRRVVDRDWPHRATLIEPVPTAGEVVEMLQRTLRPALEAGLEDLAFVPGNATFELTLPSGVSALPGKRQIDAADVALLRAAMAMGLYLIDLAEDYDLEMDSGFFGSGQITPQSLLARFATLGKVRTAPASRTQDHLLEALTALVAGYRQLNVETDDQSDDLIVFSSSFDVQKRDRWQNNAEKALASLREEGGRNVLIDGHGVVNVDLAQLLTGLDFRSFAPTVDAYAVLAGTLPDPTLAGLLPQLRQDAATRLFHFANRFTIPAVNVAIDGQVGDWPVAAEALLPEDESGDSGDVGGLDLQRLFLGQNGDDLVFRLSLARDEFAYREDETRIYQVRMRPQRGRPRTTASELQIQIEITPSGPVVGFVRDGVAVTVRHSIATDGRELELAVNRFDLLRPDEPVHNRLIRAVSFGMSSGGERSGEDRTRAVLTSF